MQRDEEHVMDLLDFDQGDWDPGATYDPICNDSPYSGPMIAVRDSN